MESRFQRIFKLWLAIGIIVIGCIHEAQSTGRIEVHFMRYTDSCSEDAGTNACDPMFSFCLSSPQKGSLSVNNCNYASTGETNDHFHNTNSIDMEFMTSIKGHRNPWVVQVLEFHEPSIMLVIKVRDADFFSWSHDHLQTWGKTLTEKVYRTKAESLWADRSMSQGGYTMRFKVRQYCDPDYYTAKCNVKCKAQDSNSGHYTCDPDTGDKICMQGWKGSACAEDINECELGFCSGGTCTNLPGDYACDCPVLYTGKNCTTRLDACRSDPCQHGGTCFSHPTDNDRYHCDCPDGWEGQDCDIKSDPCDATPCQNSGSCSSSADKETYTCTCSYPYDGDHCEIDKSTTTTTTTTTTTPTTTTSTTTTTTTTPETTTTPTTTPVPSTTPIVTTTTTGDKDTSPPSANVAKLEQGDDDSGFQAWYAAIIVAFLLIVLVILAILFIRRRRKKKTDEFTPPSSPTVTFNGQNLAFENTMYADANRSNSELERQTRQLPAVPVPDTPTDDALFNPVKPVYTEADETQGAVGGCAASDSDLKSKKKSDASVPKTVAPGIGSLTRRANEEVRTNPYADFNSLRMSQEIPEDHEEGGYQDLDEVAISVQNDYEGSITNTDYLQPSAVPGKENPYDSPTNNASVDAVPPTRIHRPTVDQTLSNNDSSPSVFQTSLSSEYSQPRVSSTPDDPTTGAEAAGQTWVSFENDPDLDSTDDEAGQEDLDQLRQDVKNNMPPAV